MYRLLVVDDEPLIVEGICNVIEENNPKGLELYKACLAEDALRILRETRMDIVMTDIRMPVVSGIDLMRQIRREWSGCKIIFLTAFEEFDYAYAAAKDSGVRFLLKAEGYGAILETIDACIGEIEAELQAEELRVQSNRQKNAVLTLRRNDFLRTILNDGNAPPSREDFAALDISFSPDTGAHILVGDFMGRSREAYEQAEVIRGLLENLMDGRVVCEVCVLEKHTAVWFIQPVDSQPDLSKIIVDRLESIQDLQVSMPSFILSGTLNGWSSLSFEYKRLKSLLDMRLISEDGFVYTAASGLEEAFTGQNFLRDSVEIVKKYIDSNLHGDISLTRLAEVAHFNPKYLSRLFGERTGTNLSGYIAGKRLEKAKLLLSENELRIQDISSAVGFLTPSYFTRFFKKATGLTPQQYREYILVNIADKR